MVMGRLLITERDVNEAARQGTKTLIVTINAIITAAARDAARKHHIEFSTKSPDNSNITPPAQKTAPESPQQISNVGAMAIAIGSDHGGFLMKEALKPFLTQQGHTIIDIGADSDKTCDYPDFAYAVAILVSSGKADRGIMIDGVGVASAIVANKVPGIRAVPCSDEFVARSSREHNNANVLTLGGRIIGVELAKSLVKVWLETPFGGGRHQPRVEKINDVEKRNKKLS